jgi:hypothetical protein
MLQNFAKPDTEICKDWFVGGRGGNFFELWGYYEKRGAKSVRVFTV